MDSTSLVPVFIAAITAVAIVALAVIFRGPLTKAMDRSDSIVIRWGDREIVLKSSQSKELLDVLFQEMKQLIDKVPLAERQRIIESVEKRSGEIRVDEIYVGFDRKAHKDELEILRHLREAQLIRPAGGSQWRADSRIEIKDFGRVLLRFMRTYIYSGVHPNDG